MPLNSSLVTELGFVSRKKERKKKKRERERDKERKKEREREKEKEERKERKKKKERKRKEEERERLAGCSVMPVVPATWETEAGKSLEPGRQRLQ